MRGSIRDVIRSNNKQLIWPRPASGAKVTAVIRISSALFPIPYVTKIFNTIPRIEMMVLLGLTARRSVTFTGSRVNR